MSITVTARHADGTEVTYYAEPVGDHLAIVRVGHGPHWQLFHRPTATFLRRGETACRSCQRACATAMTKLDADWGAVTGENAMQWYLDLSDEDRARFKEAYMPVWYCDHLPEEDGQC